MLRLVKVGKNVKRRKENKIKTKCVITRNISRNNLTATENLDLLLLPPPPTHTPQKKIFKRVEEHSLLAHSKVKVLLIP